MRLHPREHSINTAEQDAVRTIYDMVERLNPDEREIVVPMLGNDGGVDMKISLVPADG